MGLEDSAEVHELHRVSELPEKLSLGEDLTGGSAVGEVRSCCADCEERHWVCSAETGEGKVLRTSKVRTSVAVVAVD